MKTLSLKTIAVLGSAVLMAASASRAQTSRAVDYTLSGTTNAFPAMESYYDYSKPAGQHGGMSAFTSSFTPNALSVGARYYYYNLFSTSSTGYCLELTTSVASNIVPTDPKLWIRNLNVIGTIPFVAVSDDASGIYPTAHIWVKQNAGANGGGAELTLAAYTSNDNNQDLYYDIKRIEGATQASCTTGQTTFPWVALVGTTMTTGNYK